LAAIIQQALSRRRQFERRRAEYPPREARASDRGPVKRRARDFPPGNRARLSRQLLEVLDLLLLLLDLLLHLLNAR